MYRYDWVSRDTEEKHAPKSKLMFKISAQNSQKLETRKELDPAMVLVSVLSIVGDRGLKLVIFK